MHALLNITQSSAIHICQATTGSLLHAPPMPRMAETEVRRPHRSYADALAKTASEMIEAIVRKRRILFAGIVARMGEEHLPQRVMFGELDGGKGYSGGQEKNWMVHLKENMSVLE